MNVQRLIDELQEFDSEMEVFVETRNPRGEYVVTDIDIMGEDDDEHLVIFVGPDAV